jgi:hypothetical protein
LKISKEQLAPNSPQAFRDAQAASSREMAAIEPKIGALAITVEGSDAAKDLQVTIDGKTIAAVLVGVSQPVDPGEHRVEAVATGYRAQPKTLKVGEGEKAAVTLKLEVDPNAAPAGAVPKGPDPAAGAVTTLPPAGASSSGGPGSAPPPPADTGTSGGSGMRVGAYSAFGIGAVGLGLGTVFLLKAGSDRTKADEICNLPNGDCPLDRKADVDQADSDANGARTLGIVGLVVGGVSAGAGVALLVLGKGSDTKSASVRPWVGPASAGLVGRF